LPAELLVQAIRDARSAGYNVVSFSGGEPLVYAPLRSLLDEVHACGMITTVTSNGMLLDQRRIKLLRGGVDLLAISLDGVPDSHNELRANPRAFQKMAKCLEGVRRSQIPFGFIFTLTQYNLHELPWVAEFALQEGAQLLQIHPLEEVGRASECLAGNRPDNIEANYALLAAIQLDSKYGDRMRIQLDVVSTKMMQKDPNRFFVGRKGGESDDVPLAEVVSPLIIEQDGTVVPLQFGFSRQHALGNLYDASLATMGEKWRRERLHSFLELCTRVYDEITDDAQYQLANWYEIARSIGAADEVR